MDEIIDKLVEGEETVLPISNLVNLTVINTLHQELESCQLPLIEFDLMETLVSGQSLLLTLKKEYIKNNI